MALAFITSRDYVELQSFDEYNEMVTKSRLYDLHQNQLLNNVANENYMAISKNIDPIS